MIDSKAWGNFTVKGSEQIEQKLKKMALTFAQKFDSYYVKGDIKALILIGGYGRGEGGVVVKDGEEEPHNNFDVVLITSNTNNMQKAALKIKEEAEKEISFSIDMSVIMENKLKSLSPRVIWYDMMQRHKILVGQPDYLNRFNKISIEEIPQWDFRNLMINRGSLLIINDLILHECDITPEIRENLIRHIIKAIIGYGDAWLYFNGKYHCSYVQKLESMMELGNVRENFRNLYKTAAEFRLKSDYSEFNDISINEWMDELKPLLEHVFIEVETIRLNVEFQWDNYLDVFYSAEFREGKSLKDWLKKIRNIVKSSVKTNDRAKSFTSRMGVRCGGLEALCPALFPYAAFDVKSEKYRSFFDGIINHNDVTRSYLKLWSNVADKTLPANLQKYGIDLEKNL